ncbi:MAG: ribosome recycling factor [Candidatus Harrisonbacteria bacterium]|nr:ribosome recycling factor [Candidatus Harrisonbacteria bacterium]
MIMYMELEIKKIKEEVSKVVEHLKGEFGGVRSNRPSTKLVEDIQVEYFGQRMPIKALGSISIVPPREIQISVWDAGAANDVAKAIENAGIGVNPSVAGASIRINLPALSEERRKELIKLIGKMAEETRIRLRWVRDEANKMVKRVEAEGLISEDQRFRTLSEIQEVINGGNKMIEEMIRKKSEELANN